MALHTHAGQTPHANWKYQSNEDECWPQTNHCQNQNNLTATSESTWAYGNRLPIWPEEQRKLTPLNRFWKQILNINIQVNLWARFYKLLCANAWIQQCFFKAQKSTKYWRSWYIQETCN